MIISEFYNIFMKSTISIAYRVDVFLVAFTVNLINIIHFTFILRLFENRFMQLLCPYVRWVKSSFSVTGVDSPLAFHHHLPSLSFSEITCLKPVLPCHCPTWFLLATFYFKLLVHFSLLYDVMSRVSEIRAAWSVCVREAQRRCAMMGGLLV